MKKEFIGAIDQGTTSSRFVIFDHAGKIISMDQIEHKQIYTKPGWVEHSPIEIKNNVFSVIKNALKKTDLTINDLAAIGITNQRETSILWDAETGLPFYNAIVWQDTRTGDMCRKILLKKDNTYFREKCGLPVATYFSATKIKWMLDNISGLKQKIKDKKVIFGTIDSWIIWNITGGKKGGVHMTDVTNASRTMLMNLKTLLWDSELLDVFEIPETILPVIRSSSEVYGFTDKDEFGGSIPVSGCLGDQQAALFGQCSFEKGEAKNTYGTGCFLLLNTGRDIVHSKEGLITTVAYKIGSNKAYYALEGSIAIAGSLVQWIRDNLGLINSSHEIEELANKVTDNGGVYFVPAFSGLFAPYWDESARGTVIGITHFINKAHIARAVLEAVAYQTREVLEAMIEDSGIFFKSLKVDGGMVVNKMLMQFQADILGIKVLRPKVIETTVMGASFAAGLSSGFWKDKEDLKKCFQIDKEWIPAMDEQHKNALYDKWKKAVQRSLNWV